MDPFDYDIDPYTPKMYAGEFNPVGQSLQSQRASGGNNMAVAEVASAVAGALMSYFAGRRQQREAERNRQLTEEELKFEKSKYADELERQRRLALMAQEKRKQLASGELFNYEPIVQKSYRDYNNPERGTLNSARDMFTGRS